MAEMRMRHAEDDQLEKYAMGVLTESESATVEEHLLICPECQDRLTETDRYVYAMRSAAAELPRVPQRERVGLLDFSRFRWPALATAFGALAITIGIGIQQNLIQSGGVTPVSVSLQANRGPDGVGATAPARKPLELSLDLTGLRELSSYRVELVGAQGEKVWESTAKPIQGKLVLTLNKRLSAGSYFARVYSTEGHLLREYGLQLAEQR